MKDTELRIDVAEISVRLDEVIKDIEEVNRKMSMYPYENVSRKLHELIKELGFSYDENNVFDRNVTRVESALGRLQLQISSLIESFELEEVWTDGKLTYRRADKRRG